MKTVYLFHETTGAYIGPYDCHESPLEPGEYLTPTHSTALPPTIIPGFWPVMTAGAWLNSPDNRGIVYSIENGEASEYLLLGDLPSTLTKTPRPDASHVWNGSTWAYDQAAYRASVTCSAWQIRAAANRLGWRAAIEAAISSCNDHDTVDAWQYATTFHRNNPKIALIATAIGKTDADIDALFNLALTLNP